MKKLLLLTAALLMTISAFSPELIGGHVDKAVYVYEKDDGGVSPGVTAGINRLNLKEGLEATLYEDDQTNADGERDKKLLEASEGKRPCLVLLSSGRVVKVVPLPKPVEHKEPNRELEREIERKIVEAIQ